MQPRLQAQVYTFALAWSTASLPTTSIWLICKEDITDPFSNILQTMRSLSERNATNHVHLTHQCRVCLKAGGLKLLSGAIPDDVSPANLD